MNNRIDTVTRVRQLAAEHNISLSRLSRECGINHSTLSTTRARGGQLQVDTIYKICDVLQISIAEFFTVSEVSGEETVEVYTPIRVQDSTTIT